MNLMIFQRIIAKLEKLYGKPKPAPITDPLEMILLENVAYLVSYEQREKAFRALRLQIGLSPTDILSAPSETLIDVSRLGGMRPEDRARKLQLIARIVLSEFQGDLRQVLKWPVAKAKKALKRFPGIGDPGADKILLFTHTHPILALESNGLRALIRLGFVDEMKNYAATYSAAQEKARGEVIENCSWLIRAYLLLRQHGQELCKRSEPICNSCPLTEDCRYWRQNRYMRDRDKVGAKPSKKK